MVSFSFDDVPMSAVQAGGALLVAANARGTFYVCGDYASGAPGELGPFADWGALVTSAWQGHEIGCHTYHHRNNALADRNTLIAEVAANRAAMLAHGLPVPVTYAYPFGDVSARAKHTLGPRFGLLRATWPGMVTRGSDANAACAVTLEGENAVTIAGQWLARLVTEGGWLIFLTHAVADGDGPYSIRPDHLTEIIEMVQRAGCDIVTVAEGAKRLGLIFVQN